MVHKYFEERKSLREVSHEIGCTDKAVEYQLKKNGYKLRSRSESQKGRKVSDKVREVARELGKSKTGANNHNWKGYTWRGGYIAINKKDHPNATKDGYVMEHRIVMENHIGRYLRRNEDVHHINGVKHDNRIENLMLMTKSEHSAFHGKERIRNGTHNNYVYITKQEIKESIKKGGTIKEVSDRLNIERSTLYKKIKEHKLEKWYKNWRNNNEFKQGNLNR